MMLKKVIRRIYSLLSNTAVYRQVKNFFTRCESINVARTFLWGRSLKRKCLSEQMLFVSFDELLLWTSEWVRQFSRDYDLIVGVPRSGLMVAGLVAGKLGKPLTTPDQLREGRVWQSARMQPSKTVQHVLLIDDSVCTGAAILEAYQLIKELYPRHHVTRAALIADKTSVEYVDLFYKCLPHPRLFEWNLLHAAPRGKRVAFDMDGVICENCPPGVDNDESRYARWLMSAKPYLRPHFKIDYIVSCRLERYRSATEAWLKAQGVQYGELFLWDVATKEERRGGYSRHKIDYCLKVKPDLMWESNINQARDIWEATHIPTLCVDEMLLFS